ncbi:MAG: Gfo/Idh/MocA family oxidoreductase [Bacteroidota bacterium]
MQAYLTTMMETSNEKKLTSRRRFLQKSAVALGGLYIVPRRVLGGSGFVAPSDKVTMGFIGPGKQGVGLTKRFMGIDEVQFLAGADVNSKHLLRFQDQVKAYYSERNGASYNSCDIYEDYEDLLARQDIDAVIIASPDHWHAAHTIHAAEAGKDIFCEKPLSHTIAQGRAMVDAVKKNGRVLQTGSMQRSAEGFRKAVNLVRSGYLGEIKEVKVAVGDPAVPCELPTEDLPDYINWEKWVGPSKMRGYHSEICPRLDQKGWAMWRKYEEYGGGILADWGAHMFDIAQWALDMDSSGPVKISPPGTAGEFMTFEYANGIKMTHEVFGRGWAVRFIGAEGSLDVSRKFLDSDPASIAKMELKEKDKVAYHSDNHYKDWLGAVKDRSEPICSAETGHRTATICHLGNITYDLNRELTWDPVKEKFDDAEANKMRDYKERKGFKV